MLLEHLHSKMFNSSIKEDVIEFRKKINIKESIRSLYTMNKLEDVIKIYNRRTKLFDSVGNYKLSGKRRPSIPCQKYY